MLCLQITSPLWLRNQLFSTVTRSQIVLMHPKCSGSCKVRLLPFQFVVNMNNSILKQAESHRQQLLMCFKLDKFKTATLNAAGFINSAQHGREDK